MEIKWTQRASSNLVNIYNYIAKDNAAAAQRTVKTIYHRVDHLARNPKIGYFYRTEAKGEIRVILYKKYRIAYLLFSDYIEILAIIHGSMNFSDLI